MYANVKTYLSKLFVANAVQKYCLSLVKNFYYEALKKMEERNKEFIKSFCEFILTYKGYEVLQFSLQNKLIFIFYFFDIITDAIILRNLVHVKM